MPKCATKETGKENEWCRRCYLEYCQSDLGVAAPTKQCRECMVVHLKKHMYEKLEGWLCLGCAKEYDQNLLDKMTRKEETTCSGS